MPVFDEKFQRGQHVAVLEWIEGRQSVSGDLLSAPISITPTKWGRVCIVLMDMSCPGTTQPSGRTLTVTDGTNAQVFAWGPLGVRIVAGDEVYVGATGATVTLTLTGTGLETHDYLTVGWVEI